RHALRLLRRTSRQERSTHPALARRTLLVSRDLLEGQAPMPCFRVLIERDERYIQAEHAAEAWFKAVSGGEEQSVIRDAIVELHIVSRDRCEERKS
ncbi:MAG: hypothetical protein ACR2J8_14115, partial [Thermomicrobiales bacterium]